MNRGDHPESLRKQHNPQWQPQQQQQQSPYLQQGQQQQHQGYSPQRPLHPSASPSSSSLAAANRSTSPQPGSPVSPGMNGGMHINTKSGGQGSAAQRSNPSSPAVGSPGSAMEIAIRHYESLQKYLLAHILKEKHGVSEQRIAAREKLSRLLQNQLQDLSTDVYDELKRRTDGAQVPFLAVRDDYHPKRNQARQKLATLPQNRFKDLASDVYVQLERQFPTLMEMFPIKALEEKEFLSQPPPPSQPQHQDRQEREPTAPVVQQSSVVPNMATFTIQDSSNTDEDTYYRSPGQQSTQGPPAPASPALDGNVNFASLDSLMADLGNIVRKDGSESEKKSAQDSYPSKESGPKSSLNGLGIETGSPLTDSMKQEYETRIQVLCKRLQHLESEVGDGPNKPDGTRLSQVERQLTKQTELYNEQTARLTKLQLDYNKILNDYHAQLETVDMVGQEVKSLVMDNMSMKQRHLDAEEELQLAYNRIKELEDENQDLKADLDEAKKQRKQEEVNGMSHNKESHMPNVSKAPTPSHNHANDHHNHNGHHNTQAPETNAKDDDWNQGRQQVRDSTLVNPNSVIHQESLSSFRNAVDDLLSAGRSDSSSSVLVGMKSVVIACKAVTEDVEDYEHDHSQDGSFSDLKQELSSGLTQLMTAAKAHSNAFNEDEDEFERTLTELEGAADQLEAIVMDIVNVPKSKSFLKGQENGSANDARRHPLDRDHHDEAPQQHQQQQQHQQHKESEQSSMNGNGGHHYGADANEPMDAQDLKIYLETQTGLIVSSIQTLLTSLRSNSDAEDIGDASDNITKIVDQVIRMTRLTLGSAEAVSAPQAAELRSQGEMVLEDLENSLDLLNEMKEQLEADPAMAHSGSSESKSVKQKLASASFDIAKYTKELVSLIED